MIMVVNSALGTARNSPLPGQPGKYDANPVLTGWPDKTSKQFDK